LFHNLIPFFQLWAQRIVSLVPAFQRHVRPLLEEASVAKRPEEAKSATDETIDAVIRRLRPPDETGSVASRTRRGAERYLMPPELLTISVQKWLEQDGVVGDLVAVSNATLAKQTPPEAALERLLDAYENVASANRQESGAVIAKVVATMTTSVTARVDDHGTAALVTASTAVILARIEALAELHSAPPGTPTSAHANPDAVRQARVSDVDGLRTHLRFLPLTHLRGEIERLPNVYGDRLSSAVDSVEAFPLDNPQCRPFNDIKLERLYSEFVAGLEHISYIANSNVDDYRAYVGEVCSDECFRIFLNRDLPHDSRTKVRDTVNEWVTDFLPKYKAFLQYLKAEYPEVDLSAFRTR